MIPSSIVGLTLGAGAGAWVYSKMMRQTGNNTKSSLIVAAVVGGFAFMVIVFGLSSFLH